MTDAVRRFPIRFERRYAGLSRALLISPERSFVEVDAREVRVQMAWAFSAAIPRAALASFAASTKRPLSLGVHGFAGRWLVNGSRDGLVRLTLQPGQRARVIGVPVRLGELLVSVDEPAALLAALRA